MRNCESVISQKLMSEQLDSEYHGQSRSPIAMVRKQLQGGFNPQVLLHNHTA